jgi:hypothetical protein
MRAVRSDVFRETHQSSRSRDKIGQGKVDYQDTERIAKFYLGSRMTDADKRKSKKSFRNWHVKSGSPRVLSRPGATPECHTATRHTRDLTDNSGRPFKR